MGYEGLWKKRTNELYDEGEATFYKTSRFTVVESNTYSLADLANKVKSCVFLKIKLKYLLHEEMHLSLFLLVFILYYSNLKIEKLDCLNYLHFLDIHVIKN